MLLRLLFGLDRVQSFTVHEQATPPADRMDRADALRFVKDGFTVPAFLFAPVWLAMRRLWWPLAGYALAAAAILALDAGLGAPVWFAPLALVALHLVVGFEADDCERALLEAQGFATLGSVTGKGALDCERRFFDIWLPGQPLQGAAPNAVAGSPPAPARRPMQSIVGALVGSRSRS